MAGRAIRAGVAFVDLRLGETTRLFGQIRAQVAKATTEAAGDAGGRLGAQLASRVRVDSAQFGQVRDALRKAVVDGGHGTSEEIRRQLARAGRDGADGLLRAFRPLFTKGIADLAAEQRQRFTEVFDIGGPAAARAVRTLRAALLDALDDVDAQAGSAAGSMGSVGAAAERSGARISTAFGGAHQALDRFGQRTGLLGFMISNLGFMTTAAFTAPVAAIAGLSSLVGVQYAVAIQRAEAAFQGLLGSGQAASDMVNRLRAFAKASPIFDTSNVFDFARLLLGAGVSADKIIPSLELLQGITARFGLSQEQTARATLALSQVLLKGKFQFEEFHQLVDAGVPIFRILAEAMGTTEQAVQAMAREGKLGAQQVFDALLKIRNAPDFTSAIAKRTASLEGVWARVKETIADALGQAVLANAPRITAALDRLGVSLTKITTGAGPFLGVLIDVFGELVGAVARLADAYTRLSPSQQRTLAQLAVAAAVTGPLIIVIGGLVTAVGGLASAAGALLSPAGAVLAVAVALGAAFLLAWRSSQPFRELVVAVAADLAALGRIVLTVVRGIGREWNQQLGPAIGQLGHVLDVFVLPALTDLADIIAARVLPAARELGNWAREVAEKVFMVLAFIIRNVVAPALIFGTLWFDKHRESIGQVVTAVVFLAKWAGKILLPILVLIAVVTLGPLVGGFLLAAAVILAVVAVVVQLVEWGNQLVRWFRCLDDASAKATAALVLSGARVAEFLRVTAGRVVEFFAHLPAALVGIGTNIVFGLLHGIARSWGQLVDWLNRAVGGLIRAVLRQFGIRSPSAVFEAIGRQLVAGLLAGMRQDVTAVSAQARALADAASMTVAGPRLAVASGAVEPAPVHVTVKVGEKTIHDLVVEATRARAEQVAGIVDVGRSLSNRRG